MKPSKSQKGFTLAELLIVVAIVAVLVAISIPIFVNHLQKAREATCAANRRSAKLLLATAILSDDNVSSDITDGKSWKDLQPLMKDSGYHLDEDLCPSEGLITVVREGDSVRLTCSIHNGSGSGGGGTGGRQDWMSKEEEATDILSQVIDSFISPPNNNQEEKKFMEAYINKANENGGLLEIGADEILGKFENPDNGLYKINKDDPLVWVGARVFFDGKAQDLLVATSRQTVDSTNQLKGFLFYYNGNYYRSTNVNSWSGAYDYAGLTQGYKNKDDSFDKFLQDHNWELAQ